VLLGATCIATAPIFAVLAHDWTGLSPLVTAMWRTSLSVPLIVFVLVWREGWRSPSWRGSSEPWWLLLPGLFFAGDLAAWHSSMTIISAGGATFLANLAAVIVPIVAWFWLSERPRRPFFFGATIAVVGAGLLLVRPDVDVMQTLPNSGSRYAWGNFLGVLTAGCYAGYQLSSRVVRRQLSTLRTMAWTTIVCSLVLVLVAWSSTDQWVPSESRGWLPLVGMALFGQVLGQGLIVWSMRLVSASVVAVALLWQPLAASLLGFLVLGQRISFVQALGMVGVLLGLATVALRGRG
jgi:drug/metabolite transporter (DMT)-like permease